MFPYYVNALRSNLRNILRRQRNDIQPRGEIAATFDEAFNRLYMQKYDISIVRKP